MRELIGPLVSVQSLVFFSDMYCFFDPPVHFVAFSVDRLSLIPIYDMLRVMAWSVIADLFYSVAADLLVLRV